MPIPAIPLQGGDAAPSAASAKRDGSGYLTMNNPFSVAGSGGKANATATTGINFQSIAWLALAGFVAYIIIK